MVVFICGIFLVWITAPILYGTYRVYFKHQKLILVEGEVVKQSSAILAPGLYFSLTLNNDEKESYAYIFPTIYRFTAQKYTLVILPGTNAVLDIKQVQ